MLPVDYACSSLHVRRDEHLQAVSPIFMSGTASGRHVAESTILRELQVEKVQSPIICIKHHPMFDTSLNRPENDRSRSQKSRNLRITGGRSASTAFPQTSRRKLHCRTRVHACASDS